MAPNNSDLSKQGAEIYNLAVNQVLAGYQLIEEMLKSYLETHFDLVRKHLDGRLHFDFQRSDYQDAALGRLVQAFSKLCANKQLIVDLRSVVRHRDHIAHNAFLKTYSENVTSEEYVQLHEGLLEDMQRSRDLMDRVVAEHRAIEELGNTSGT